MSSTSSRSSVYSNDRSPMSSRPSSYRLGSVSHYYNPNILLSTASYCSTSSDESSLPGSPASSLDLSSDFDFDDVFNFDDHDSAVLSRMVESKPTISPSSSNKRAAAHRQYSQGNVNRVVATKPRASTLTPRRHPTYPQHPNSDTPRQAPKSPILAPEDAHRFSYSHYTPTPQITATTHGGSDAGARRKAVTRRTSPGAYRLHEMLARGR